MQFVVPTLKLRELTISLGREFLELRPIVSDPTAECAQHHTLTVLAADRKRATVLLRVEFTTLDPATNGALSYAEMGGKRLRIHEGRSRVGACHDLSNLRDHTGQTDRSQRASTKTHQRSARGALSPASMGCVRANDPLRRCAQRTQSPVSPGPTTGRPGPGIRCPTHDFSGPQPKEAQSARIDQTDTRHEQGVGTASPVPRFHYVDQEANVQTHPAYVVGANS